MNDLIDSIVELSGLEASTILTICTAIVLLSQVLARVIPDDATGILAIVRKVVKVLGLYASYRVQSGVSVADVAKNVVAADQKRGIFGVMRDPKTGKFIKNEDGSAPLRPVLVMGVVGALMLAGCNGEDERPAVGYGIQALNVLNQVCRTLDTFFPMVVPLEVEPVVEPEPTSVDSI